MLALGRLRGNAIKPALGASTPDLSGKHYVLCYVVCLFDMVQCGYINPARSGWMVTLACYGCNAIKHALGVLADQSTVGYIRGLSSKVVLCQSKMTALPGGNRFIYSRLRAISQSRQASLTSLH